jgi:membrane associated rhomboid family serine protease
MNRVCFATLRAMLDDRSYMRENPHRSPWSATVILMMIIGVCFVLQAIVEASTQFPINRYFALNAAGLKSGFIWQLIAFQFMHGGLLHLAFNLIGLWCFGRVVEDRLGKQSFLKLYFLCGVAGGLLQAGLGAFWPERFGGSTVGASAGVLGLLAAFALLHPDAMISIFFVLPIQARYILWLELIVSVSLTISAAFTTRSPGSNIAHAAHLGGILAAMAFMRWEANRPAMQWNPLQGRRRKRELVQAAAKITRWRGQREESPTELPPEEFISKEVDPILDKISAHGIHSLTPRERQILEAARTKMGKR